MRPTSPNSTRHMRRGLRSGNEALNEAPGAYWLLEANGRRVGELCPSARGGKPPLAYTSDGHTLLTRRKINSAYTSDGHIQRTGRKATTPAHTLEGHTPR